jgi:meso-butanediol dehydrogenase/(S,S)-butanediol dehydrogenase/diacetyl reductase
MTGLEGKVAIVTGGARGIGAAIADRLANAGASVVVGDLNDPGSDVYFHELDVTSEASIAAFFAAVLRDHGGLDVLVNNAGIMFEEHIEEHATESWNAMVAVNLTGPFLMTKHATPLLRQRGRGAIVNVSSIEAFACNPNHAAYAATKAGVMGLTAATAVDLGPIGVRCNAVAPGWIDTELNASYVDAHPDRDEVIAQLSKLHPVGHIGDTSDVGDVVAWLAGDESSFVTGQTITIDGGRTTRPSLPPIMGY